MLLEVHEKQLLERVWYPSVFKSRLPLVACCRNGILVTWKKNNL